MNVLKTTGMLMMTSIVLTTGMVAYAEDTNTTHDTMNTEKQAEQPSEFGFLKAILADDSIDYSLAELFQIKDDVLTVYESYKQELETLKKNETMAADEKAEAIKLLYVEGRDAIRDALPEDLQTVYDSYLADYTAERDEKIATYEEKKEEIETKKQERRKDVDEKQQTLFDKIDSIVEIIEQKYEKHPEKIGELIVKIVDKLDALSETIENEKTLALISDITQELQDFAESVSLDIEMESFDDTQELL